MFKTKKTANCKIRFFCIRVKLIDSFDESAEELLLVYCKFTDKSSSKISKHMFCKSFGTKTNV